MTFPFALLVLGSPSIAARSQSPSESPGVPLAVVQPIRGCAALANVDLSGATGVSTTERAAVVETPKGEFCHVTGTIAPAIGFEVDLPVAKWTQRLVQSGCGGLCGTINASIGQAGGCLPATNGEFVVAASDLGHEGRMGSPTEGDFAEDPQKRIDFAYRGNHLTALAAKALILAYYGRSQRYAYFSGCSDGGREALMEAERYPDDFDGISAGAPAMLFQVQNSFWHAWTTAANRRADGSPILSSERLPVLHAAILAHCDMTDGTRDGIVGDPRACRPDPSWSACGPAAQDTSGCLTTEEWAAALRLYAGPTDRRGDRFLPGGAQPGSEMQWRSGGRPTGPASPRGPEPGDVRREPSSDRSGPDMASRGPGGPPSGPAGGPGGGMLASMGKVVYLDPRPGETVAASFPFTTEQFARVNVLHPLNDATDPDLSRFAAHGGRLIMYHGWSDTSIAPMISIAYRQAVIRTMGEAAAAGFLRLFMIPGMGHCGGGDGFPQIDTLTALMAWVERGSAPSVLVAGRTAGAQRPSGGPDGRGGGLGGARPTAPYARADAEVTASRPVYPYPQVARYAGNGDPTVAASYVSEKTEDPVIDWYGKGLMTPGFQKRYEVRDGKLAGT